MTTLKLSLITLNVILFSSIFSISFDPGFNSRNTSSPPHTDFIFTEPDPICTTDSSDCHAFLNYPFSIVPDQVEGIQVSYELKLNGGNPEEDIFGTLAGDGLDYSIGGTYPIGNHSFLVKVEEMDGTISTEEMPFSVVDCLAPTLSCVNGLAVELMPVDSNTLEGAIVLYVEDLVAAATAACSETLTYSINLSGEPVDPDQDSIVYGCCMPDVLIVEVYAWDNADNPYAVQPDGALGGPNYDVCETYVLIQDNLSICDCPDGEISGTIRTELNEGIEGVTVSLTGDDTQTTLTNAAGNYTLENLAPGGNYTITPQLDSNILNGVSIFDKVLIHKHILGIQYLDSPYKMIAADVNNSGSITTLDLIELTQGVLGLLDEFPNNSSWRFVAADYVFPDPANPWAEDFPEYITIENFEEPTADLDFIGVKVGDVNGSAITNE